MTVLIFDFKIYVEALRTQYYESVGRLFGGKENEFKNREINHTIPPKTLGL